jgi:hypothetical protein
MVHWLEISLVTAAAVVLFILSKLRRSTPAHLRNVEGLSRLYRAFGLSVEDGTRLLVALGAQSLLTRNAGSALAGLGLLGEASKRASISDRPPVAVTGEAALALLAQDSLQAGFRSVGAAEYYQPTTGRLAGLTPFSSVAATMSMLDDDHVSVAAAIGHFGAEAGLLAEAAERSGTVLLGATGNPAGQAVLYATGAEALIGEELFAAPAYLSGRPDHRASLAVQDALRWLVIAVLLVGALLRILGLA